MSSLKSYMSFVKCQFTNNKKSKIANMAEAAIARREARRKKILENSHNRLQLISGKNADDVGKESPISSSIFDDSLKNSPSKESCNINKCLVNNGVLTNAGLETLSILSTNQEDFAIGDGDVPFPKHDSTAFTSPTPEPVQVNPPTFEKLVSHKYDIVLLSLLIQLLYNFSIVTFERGYFFLPLAIYVTTKLAMIPKQQNSNFANIILMLNCMPPNRAQKIMSITQLVSTFTQDVCIFLFTTICTQTLWQTLRVNVL